MLEVIIILSKDIHTSNLETEIQKINLQENGTAPCTEQHSQWTIKKCAKITKIKAKDAESNY